MRNKGPFNNKHQNEDKREGKAVCVALSLLVPPRPYTGFAETPVLEVRHVGCHLDTQGSSRGRQQRQPREEMFSLQHVRLTELRPRALGRGQWSGHSEQPSMLLSKVRCGWGE